MSTLKPTASSFTALTTLVIALAALAGSLWLSIGMGLKACPLCFYQRTFVMGVTAIYAVGLCTEQRSALLLHLVALPIALAGLSVAGFHCYLEWTGVLECPLGIFGLGTAPQQSLVIQAVLFANIALAILARAAEQPAGAPFLAGLVLGPLLAWSAIASAPPMPPAPAEPNPVLDGCRRPVVKPS